MSAVHVQVDNATGPKRWVVWAGWFLGAVALFVVLSSVRWKLTRDPWYAAEWERIGYSAGALRGIGLLQLTCVVLYLIPPTAVLGTVLFTGYLGGAIATYVRIGEPYPALVPLSTALLLWAGIYLREERLRSLLPFRRNAAR
jgi:DoxX-like family